MILIKEFEFDAAHNLTKYHGKCERLHGHTYRLVVMLNGTPDSEDMVFDFTELKNIVGENVLKYLDHAYLNDLLPNPTAENIAVFVWDTLFPLVERNNAILHEIQVWETKTSGIIYRGERSR